MKQSHMLNSTFSLMRLKATTVLAAAATIYGLPSALGASGTSLEVTTNGVLVTRVDTRTMVQLTARVMAGSSHLMVGQVKFCDADAPYCKDVHLLGISQLTKAGTATVRLVPGPGLHHYKAVFVGTTNEASSTSAVSPLVVGSTNTPYLSRTTISASGNAGSYTLTSTVTGAVAGLPMLPKGEVYFQDRSNNAAELGKTSLPTGFPEVNYTSIATSYRGYANTEGRMVTADFNGDGQPDLAMCGDKSLTVAVGNGDGSFKPPPALLKMDCRVLFTGDFNEDGNADLVVVYSGKDRSATSELLLGKGDGHFKAPINIPLVQPGYPVYAEAAGDFNHDGHVDLVINKGLTMQIQLGNGDGTFRPGWESSPSESIDFLNGLPVVVGDFNGDGNPDFAIPAFGGEPEFVCVFLGQADLSFVESDYRWGLNIVHMAVADFNVDGKDDLAIPYEDDDADDGVAHPGGIVMLGHADGRFTRTMFRTDAQPYSVFAEDFNGDGLPDLGIGEYLGSGNEISFSTTILLNNGDGTFARASRTETVTATSLLNPQVSAAADFNGDGVPDLAAFGIQSGSGALAYGTQLSQLAQTVSVSGKAPSGPGEHQVVARYQGNETFLSSVSKPIVLSVLTSPAPVATLSTTLVQFPNQVRGKASNAKTATLTNTGTAPLALTGFRLLPPVDPLANVKGLSYASSNNCPASLTAGASCKIRFRFYPYSTGLKVTQFVITDNAANSPQTVLLTGTGTTKP